jgi:hypothetical protein
MSGAGESLSAFTSQHSTKRNLVWTVTPNDEATQLAQLADLVKLESEKPELAAILDKAREGALKGLNETGKFISRGVRSILLDFFWLTALFAVCRARGLHTSYPPSRPSPLLSSRRSRSLDRGRRRFPSWSDCRCRSVCEVTEIITLLRGVSDLDLVV